MSIPFAFVHHANQYLITNGYDNRHGLREAIGSLEDKSGFAWVLELHRRYRVPANLHLSGTLIEAIAWHQPAFLRLVRDLLDEGLIEIVGSCYGQNIMRFFSYEHNFRQLNEELHLFQTHLGVDPETVQVFWPPERVWDTPRMAPVLRDPRLLNRGYEYVLLDDRLLLPMYGYHSPRKIYDRQPAREIELHQACAVEAGQGLIALPISTQLRLNIPPGDVSQFENIRAHCYWLMTQEHSTRGLIALYGDDMEKAAGIGSWNPEGPAQFERVLRWICEDANIKPVRICDWAAETRPADSRPIDVGTFLELANHFAAGEGYEKWFFDPQWERYRQHYAWTEGRVQQVSLSGADDALIDLANKHLMAAHWESAWHTPSEGPFGDPNCSGEPSPWIRALASHSRHAAVIAEASYWAKHHDGQAHADLYDIDADGEDELVIKNDKLFAVISPRWGGRLVALFSIEKQPGQMVVGNPSDDWNWMQELNRFMEVPANHPGALCDAGMEHDAYAVQIESTKGAVVEVELKNVQIASKGMGLTKRIHLESSESSLGISYSIPESVGEISIGFAFSPDYLSLLRYGSSRLRLFTNGTKRGCTVNSTTVWVRAEDGAPIAWREPHPQEGGHKATWQASVSSRAFSLSIGVSR